MTKGFIHPRYHGRLERGHIILQKGNVYVNREDGEQYELIEYLDEDAQVMTRNLHTRQSNPKGKAIRAITDRYTCIKPTGFIFATFLVGLFGGK
ncbi:hypothetical protein L5B97_08900 [Avibacterium sp. 20-15]|nr:MULTISPECIES: hypothetical protein [unclassified Avibacterium]MCW9733576.1 hypothetical protein [Avibacterium sp. 20-15]URL05556.1 hypothetical protein L4F93_07590 [Avibacterium sp. 20-132]